MASLLFFCNTERLKEIEIQPCILLLEPGQKETLPHLPKAARSVRGWTGRSRKMDLARSLLPYSSWGCKPHPWASRQHLP